jgi:hypothetical protein
MTSRGMRHLVSELDYRDRDSSEQWGTRPLTDILNEHKGMIPFGSPGNAIDELGEGHRQLLEATEYFAGSWGLFKKITPEDDLDRAIDFSKLPKNIQSTIELFDIFEIDDSSLRNAICGAAENDPTAIQWISDNIELFIDPTTLYAVEEYGVEDVERTTWNPSEVKLQKSFRPPKDHYTLAEGRYFNKYQAAADRRKAHLRITLQEIAGFKSVSEVTKFSYRIFDSYKGDKELLSYWTPQQKEKDKALYLQFLRARNLDMETIRGKLWWCFERDKNPHATSTEDINPVKKGWTEHFSNGKVDKDYIDEEKVATVPCEIAKKQVCQWEIEKSDDYCLLTQTTGQWHTIWNSLWQRLEKLLVMEARMANTKHEQNKIRRYLSKYQDRISEPCFEEVVDILIEKNKEETHVR